MSTAYPVSPTAYGGLTGWLCRSEAWLDARGRWAWLSAMILGFIFAWPVGLALLGYMIWSNRMFTRTIDRAVGTRSHSRADHQRMKGTSGNSAFDAYKSETLRRLESEQEAFEAFLQRLRDAKDKSEFDIFMDERAKVALAPREDSAA